MQEYSEHSYERYRRPSDILERIGQGIEELDLIDSISTTKPIYRGRMHNESESPNDSTTLGSPPDIYAGYNRMNPEGISMFYGAFDPITSRVEIWDNAYTRMTMGKFYSTRELKVIDFTKLDSIEYPSLFDVDKYDIRMLLGFYREFVKQITSPVEDKDKLEYIPTQVVTEYFRHVFSYKGNKVDGIIYKSSKDKGEVCTVLFVDNSQCKDDRSGVLYVDKDSILTTIVS